MFLKKINFSNTLFILGTGLFIRLFFTLFVAKHYYGMENFFMQGDTGAWARSFHYWYYSGTYTFDPLSEYGGFVRMPGYSFFLGIFYLISGKDWLMAYKICAYTQVFIDVFNIYLIKIIAQKVFNDARISTLATWLFVLYPFTIVWGPVCYSEILSLNLLLVALWFFVTRSQRPINIFWCAFFIALDALVRPQIAIVFPVFGIMLLFGTSAWSTKIKHACVYGITVLLVFGSWPARNYFSQGKFVLMQDLRGSPNWNGEVLAFTSFIYSAQADWEPQFTQIVENKPVDYPKYFVGTAQDSAKLQKAFALSKECGVSFSFWKKYWRGSFIQPNACTDTIVKIFTELRENQIKRNPFIFYLVLPLQNLKKAVFKSSLYDTKSVVRRLASWLFIYRTFLIITALIGCFLMIKKTELKMFGWLAFLYWLLLYVTLSAGTGPMFRNIEIRYFLHTDVVLLLPAAYLFFSIYKRYSTTKA